MVSHHAAERPIAVQTNSACGAASSVSSRSVQKTPRQLTEGAPHGIRVRRLLAYRTQGSRQLVIPRVRRDLQPERVQHGTR
jgi:hypothetical protein